MEASAASSSSQPHRKEWRAVSQEQEHAKLGQSDERTIYEVQEGAGTLEVDYCSITIDAGGGSLSGDDLLRQRLQEIGRQREELNRMEVELRARAIAQSEIMNVQRGVEARIKEHADAAAKLKEQLQERDQHIIELEMKLEDNNRELRAMKIDTEMAWAKEDLLMEQNKELATFRRERDNSEAERAQHLQKIHDLQQHIQEKDTRFIALEEQNRVAQESILFKDEQLREAQTWIARAQEMDALHSTTNQSLHAELRERTEQFNQYWIGLQRQFADMERHHLQTIQQLQLELAETRDRNGIYKDGSQVAHENSTDSSSDVQNKRNEINMNDGGTSNDNLGFTANGNSDSAQSFVSASTAPTMTEHGSGVPVVPSSILGMARIGTFLPPSQMTALHPYVMHPQGVPHAVPSNNAPSPHTQLGHFQPAPISLTHDRQNKQAALDVSKVHDQTNTQPHQVDQNLLRSDVNYNFQNSDQGQTLHPHPLNVVSVNPHERPGPVVNGPSESLQVPESNDNQYPMPPKPEQNLTVSLGFDPSKQKSELKVQEESLTAAKSQSPEKVLASGQQRTASVVPSAAGSHPSSSNTVAECNDGMKTSSSQIPGKTMEHSLLDERSLLSCIVRAIPAGSDGRIRISTTLPNRLGKMLAPLHWHDYKKYYGKLDDFVTRHPELFVIEGDFIHLREGAQETISATAAYAKVAAAAAASAPYSSLLPSVAVTPVAQNNRQKKVTSVDSKYVNTVSTIEGGAMPVPVDSYDRRLQSSNTQNKQPNGASFNIVRGAADLKVSSRSKDLQELNGLSSEARSSHSSIHTTVGNGTNIDRTTLAPSKGLSNGRHNFGGKQQGRSSGAGLISRKQN